METRWCIRRTFEDGETHLIVHHARTTKELCIEDYLHREQARTIPMFDGDPEFAYTWEEAVKRGVECVKIEVRVVPE